MEIREFEQAEEMTRKAAAHIAEIAEKAVEKKGFFTMALAGGNSPRQIYSCLAEKPLSAKMPWKHTYVFWGDERHIDHTHNDSNYRMAYDTLLSKVEIPPKNIFRVPVEVKPAETAAALYERMMIKFFREFRAINRETHFPVFDLIILGVGTDGHTASLFPGHRAVNEKKKWVMHVKAHARVTLRERITMTLPLINNAEDIMFIISGQGKGKVIKQIFSAPPGIKKQYPAAKIGKETQSVWFIDTSIYEEGL